MESELVDIADLKYDFGKSLIERSCSFLKFIKNPNKFRCGEYTITVEFSGYSDFESCLAQGLKNAE